MSTNEIELTFIRCQNCKSLMPSTSQVCGMCGHQRSAESSDNKSKNRLRQQSDVNIGETFEAQKSSSSPESQENNAPEKLQFTKQNKEKQFEPSTRPQKERDDSERDQSRKATFNGRSGDSALSFGRRSTEDQPREENNETVRREQPTFTSSNRQDVKKGLSFSQTSRDDEFEDEEDDFDDDSYSDEGDDKIAVHDQFNDQSVDRPPRKRKRRRKKKNHAHSDGLRPVDNQPVQSDNNFKEQRQEEESPRAAAFSGNPKSDTPPEQAINRQARQEPVRHEPTPKPEQERNERALMESPQNYSKTQPSNSAPDTRSQPKFDAVDGQLIGWLVNFSTNRKGNSFELRTGRRFIGRQALRQDDLIIQDSAVSTPHALLHVDAQQVVIQDLMSETGTFVKSFGSYDFTKMEASTKLKHGDILKLGNYELIVCLVPQS